MQGGGAHAPLIVSRETCKYRTRVRRYNPGGAGYVLAVGEQVFVKGFRLSKLTFPRKIGKLTFPSFFAP